MHAYDQGVQLQPLLTDAVPGLAPRLLAALRAAGRADLAEQLTQVRLRQATYDSTVDAGYLYVTESRPLNIAEQSAIRIRLEETVFLAELPGTVVVDVENVGRVQGVELLGYAEVFRMLGVAP